MFDEWNMEIVFTSSLQKNPSTVGLARYLTRRMGEPTMMRTTTSIMKVTGNVILAKLTSMWGVSLVEDLTASKLETKGSGLKKVEVRSHRPELC